MAATLAGIESLLMGQLGGIAGLGTGGASALLGSIKSLVTTTIGQTLSSNPQLQTVFNSAKDIGDLKTLASGQLLGLPAKLEGVVKGYVDSQLNARLAALSLKGGGSEGIGVSQHGGDSLAGSLGPAKIPPSVQAGGGSGGSGGSGTPVKQTRRRRKQSRRRR